MTSVAFLIVVTMVPAFVLLVALALRSGHDYSVEDTESHAVEYAGVIREGHGGMTAFLWVTCLAIFGWAIAYLIQHRHEF
jgi:hypothetical protein